MRTVQLTIIVCIGFFVATLRAAEFEHRFGAATPGEPAFIIGFDPKEKAVELKDGLRIKHVAKDGNLDSRGVKTVFGVRGDGTIRLNFSASTIGTPDSGWGSGAMLRLDFVDPEARGLTVALQGVTNGQTVLMVDWTTNGQDQHEVATFALPEDAIPMKSGVIEVQRIGSKMIVAASSDSVGNGTRTVIAEHDVPTQDIYPIGVWVGTAGARADLDVTLRSLSVSGASLPGDSAATSTGWSMWSVLQFAMLMLLVVSGGWMIRRGIVQG